MTAVGFGGFQAAGAWHGSDQVASHRLSQAAPQVSELGDQFDGNSGDFRMKLDA